MTVYDLPRGLSKGLRRGVREGRQQEGIELALRLLSRKLGAISAAREKAIRSLPLARIEALLDFRSKADLSRWLKSHP